MTLDSPVTKALMAGVTAIVAVWLVVVVAWPDAPFALTFDDAWYYLGIARNISEGRGSTFDGINTTNGYHPLWLLICVGAFAIGLDDLAAERVLLVVQVLGYGGALAVLAQVVSRFTEGWPAGKTKRPGALKAASLLLAATFTFVAGNPFVVKTFANGLETGVSVLPLALVLWWGVRADGAWLTGLTPRQRRGASVILAVAFLARTDAAFLLACIAIGITIEWIRAESRPTLEAFELLACPIVVVAAYLAYNQVAFGGFIQVSGLVKRAPLRPTNGAAFLLFVGAAAWVQRNGIRRLDQRRSGPRGRFPRAAAFVHQTGWYASFCVLIVGYYLFLQTQVWLWYFCPVVLYGLVLLTLGSADFAEEALRTASTKASAQRALLPVWLVLGVPMLLAFVITGGQFADPNLRSIQIANADAGAWLRGNTDRGDRFASWDAGALGYFSHRSVVNLDGVVNSRAFYLALRAGGPEVGKFLRCDRVRYIVNHGGDVNGEDPDMRRHIANFYDDQIAAEARVVYTQPFLYDGVTAGSAGISSSGLQRMAVHVYELPERATLPIGGCPGST